MIFGKQLCKWILIILVNLLRWVPCTSLTWWRNVDVTEIMPFIVHVTLSPCCRERRQILSLHAEMWPPNSPDLNPVDYSIWDILQERVHRSRIHDVKELKERLLREWRLLDHTIIIIIIITAAIPQWRSRLNARVTWTVDILNIIVSVWLSAVFVCFINIGFCKCDRYKHVQSANIVWDVLLLCLTLSHGMVAT